MATSTRDSSLTPPHRARRADPGRRDRIIDACIEVIARDGVDGTSMRRVAEEADVPLGSMTYHFTDRDELLHEALKRFSLVVSDRFVERMSCVEPTDRAAAVDAVRGLILQDTFPNARELVLTHELYTLAARRPEFRALTNEWMARSRAALERCFDPLTARMLDAFIEGIAIHRALDNAPADDRVVTEGIERIVAGSRQGGMSATTSHDQRRS